MVRTNHHGICQVCQVDLRSRIENASRIITDSIRIIEESKNQDTRLARCDLVLEHAEGLISYERLGIETLVTPPSEIISRIRWAASQVKSEDDPDGQVRHHPELTHLSHGELQERAEAARKANDLEEWETVLLQGVSKTEQASELHETGVIPWYYERLAVLYRKQKRIRDEVAILERFMEVRHAPGVTPKKLRERLCRAKEIESQVSDRSG